MVDIWFTLFLKYNKQIFISDHMSYDELHAALKEKSKATEGGLTYTDIVRSIAGPIGSFDLFNV